MKLAKPLLLILLLAGSLNFAYSKVKIPHFINTEEKIFLKLAKTISNIFPENVEILVYDLNLLNGPEELKEKINQIFNKIFSSNQDIYNFSVKFEKEAITDAKKEDKKIDLTFIEKKDELELITFGKFLKQDAIMLSSVTIFNNKTKNIWDKTSKKWIKKRVALFQGNFFSTENNNSLLRFSYYFLLD